MASCTEWMAPATPSGWPLLLNTPVVAISSGFVGCARDGTNILSVSVMRWYMEMALRCSSVVAVDTASWKGMVTHEEEEDG